MVRVSVIKGGEMSDLCLERMLQEWPEELGSQKLYNPETGLYCVVGFALHCAGIPDEKMWRHPGDVELDDGTLESATQVAADLCGLTEEIWGDLMEANDRAFETNRDRALAMYENLCESRWMIARMLERLGEQGEAGSH